MKIPINLNNHNYLDSICIWSLVAGWIFGFAITKGFWMTLGCFVLPPLSWVVTINWILANIQ